MPSGAEKERELLTRTDFPFALECGAASETAQGEEVEEDLGGMEHDCGFGYNHLAVNDASVELKRRHDKNEHMNPYPYRRKEWNEKQKR